MSFIFLRETNIYYILYFLKKQNCIQQFLQWKGECNNIY